MQFRALLMVFGLAACGGPSATSGAAGGSGGTPAAAGATSGSGGSASGAAGTSALAGGGALSEAGASSGSGGTATGGATGGAGAATLAGAAGSAGSSGGGGMAGSGGTSSSTQGRKLLMVGLSTGKPSPGDTIMINRLQARGFEVMLVADTQVTAAAADGKDLILISSSEESANLGTKLRDLALPILCMEDGSYADMKMASARGHGMATTALDFTKGTPLSGNLSGMVTIASAHNDPDDMGWGTVGPKAFVAATIVAHPEQAVLFGYDKGDEMVGMTAPARRVGFAAREPVASRLSEQGLQVFDTAVNWVLGP